MQDNLHIMNKARLHPMSQSGPLPNEAGQSATLEELPSKDSAEAISHKPGHEQPQHVEEAEAAPGSTREAGAQQQKQPITQATNGVRFARQAATGHDLLL